MHYCVPLKDKVMVSTRHRCGKLNLTVTVLWRSAETILDTKLRAASFLRRFLSQNLLVNIYNG